MSKRREERLAIALHNLRHRWSRPDSGWCQLLDYQVPLKAQRGNSRIGKIDLLGVTDQGRLVVVELKVESQSGGPRDSPPAALMEGLRYAALVEADLEAIAYEIMSKFGIEVARIPPVVQVLAPTGWWKRWLSAKAAGEWGLALARLSACVAKQTGLAIEYMALENVEIAPTIDDLAPRLERVPSMHPVLLGQPLVHAAQRLSAPTRRCR